MKKRKNESADELGPDYDLRAERAVNEVLRLAIRLQEFGGRRTGIAKRKG